MNCEKFMQMLDRYAELSDIEMAELEKHAMDCDNCRAELEFMRSIIGTVQELPPIEPPQDFLQTLNARLDKELAQEPKIRYFMRQAKPYVNRYGAIAACLAIGIVIGANGNMLVSRMNNDDDGVISTTSTVSDNGTTPVADNAATPVPVAEVVPEITPEAVNNSVVAPVIEEKITPKVDTGTTVKPSVNTNTVPPVKVAEQVKQPSIAAPTAKPAVPRNAITSTIVSSNVTAEPKKAQETPATPKVQATVTQPPVVQESTVQVANSEPVIKEDINNVSIAEDANAGIMTASLDEAAYEVPAGYRSVRIISEPEDAPEMYAQAEVAEQTEANIAAEYSIAEAPAEESAYVAPLSSTLMIKAEDEARAKEIIMGFVEATYGNYYMITGDKLYSLTVRLESEGIWYQANITDSGVKVSFKLVTM